MVEERNYTVPLGKAYDSIRTKRVRKAVKLVQTFVARHSKVAAVNVRLSNALNSALWARGIQKPPRKIRIKVVKEEEKARAYLMDEKIAKEEKKAETVTAGTEKKAESPGKKEEKPSKEEVKKTVEKKMDEKKEKVVKEQAKEEKSNEKGKKNDGEKEAK
ncbi:50S ribosomal protein L31e [Candidatus Micrarchaeota archaeon]|nr:50S ribosomal protein L31e [Candidatus Micrarchaeota archaeon]